MFKFKRKRAIAIFSNHSDFFSNPTLLYLCQLLEQSEVTVLIYTSSNPKTQPINLKHARFFPIPVKYPRLPRKPWIFFRVFFWPYIICFYNSFLYDVRSVIGVDIIGYLTASSLLKYDPGKFHYISFELLFKSEMIELNDVQFLKFKKQEDYFLSKGVKSLVVQDKYRHKLFLNETPLSKIERTYFVPVSPKRESNTNLAEKRVKIAGSKKIKVIYAGSLYDWSGINEILSAIELSKSFRIELTIHTRNQLSTTSPLVQKVASLRNKGIDVNIHERRFEFSEFCNYLQDFDIGLATYVPNPNSGIYNGLNFSEIGYSSGKFSTYMMMGLPTITTKSTSYIDLKKQYNFGFVIDDFSEIPIAIERIANDYENHSRESLRLYDQVLSPDLSIHSYIENILS